MVNSLEIRKRRCSKGYFSQAAMAEAMGMKKANYGNRESGKVAFSADEIVKLCSLLDWTLEEGMSVLT